MKTDRKTGTGAGSGTAARPRTYTDDQIRECLRKWIDEAELSFRAAAGQIPIDHAHLYRMLQGKMPVSEKAARKVGFRLVESPERWEKVSQEKGQGNGQGRDGRR